MGQKAKKGKQRKDKFYHLAKDSGYRARSAFKLIQLDRKLGLLESSRVAIDLCAAPGGWLQVLQNCLPVSSVIIGVDLVPIKPIPNVITLQEDITTDSCVSALSKHLQSWKADIVLNDGAPNVGQSWVQDAFSQSKLTLAAFRIAVKFLKKGGCFVTKIFRSKDYLALNWVFKQLFIKVKATKPQASRNESAEIYVICQNFKAPDKIDPKFFDIKHVFKDMADPDAPSSSADKLRIGQPFTKAKALGYEENTLTVYKDFPVTTFLSEDNFIPVLNFCTELKFDDEEIESHPLTTDEIKAICKDVQLISKKGVKLLLKWRAKMRQTYWKKLQVAETKEPVHTDQTPALTEEEKEAQLEDHLAKVEKKKRTKLREQKVKLRQKMALGANSIVEEDETLFTLTQMKSKHHLDLYEESGPTINNEIFDNGVSEPIADENGTSEFQSAQWKRSKSEYKDRNTWMEDLYSEDEASSDSEISLDEGDDDTEQVDTTEKEQNFQETNKERRYLMGADPNPLLATGNQKLTPAEKAKQWYASHDVFADVSLKEDAELDLQKDFSDDEKEGKRKKKKASKTKPESLKGAIKETAVKQKMKSLKSTEDEENDRTLARSIADRVSGKVNSRGKATQPDVEADDALSETDEEMPSSDDDDDSESDAEFDVGKTTKNQLLKRKLTPEQLALGHEIAFSAKRRREIIESGFHRFAYHDENADELPKWFKHEEDRHTRPIVPLNKELVTMYRERLKEINSRPIKKVAEARARKKAKITKKLENIRGKAEKIANTPGASEREKLLQIKGLYKKTKVNKKMNKEKTYVVTKKKGSGKAVNPSKGSKKGPVRFVDKRMKADKRTMKLKTKAAKKKGKKLPQQNTGKKQNKPKNIAKNKKR